MQSAKKLSSSSLILIVVSVVHTVTLDLEKNGMFLFMVTLQYEVVGLGIPKNSDSELAQVNRWFVLYTFA